ncbi:general transcription factor II-I repeat domain-containing protein 2A-like [Stigmatopora nigra]
MEGKKCTAKRKYEDEHRTFLTEWESLYFFVERNGKPFCLICQASLAHFKASNLQRHFSSLHADIAKKFPKGTELHKHKLATLKSQAEKQTHILQKFTKHSETVTLASYQLAWNIARAKKPYNEGEFIKKCLGDVVEILSPENDKLKRMVSDVQLSRHTVEHRISDINTSIESQLHSDLQACEYFSVALDESCDIQDKPQLAIFVRSVSNDCLIKEELLDIVPLKERTRGIDVKETMMAAFAKANLPIAKLTAIATDGAPAMIGSFNGLVGLCQADQTFPGFWNFHCIIHREQLVSKSLNLDNVMKPVMEIVNYIRTHALNHRQFKNLIAALDQGLPGDLPLHCTVRWLSKGQVLSRFFELLDAVKLFMEEKDKDYPVLSDLEWIMDLAFLVDMLCHLDRLNLTLQATSAALNKQRARYATLVENLHESFVARFRDLQLKRPQITFLVDPFNAETDCLKALLVTDEAAAELEMIDLCEEDQLKPALREGTIEFWKSVPMEKYPNVKQAALKILSMFGSTYVCESVFSTLKHVKSKHRSVLTDTHVKELLRVATTEYKPDLKRIVQGKECQKSH